MLTDLRYALRSLRKQPGFTAAAVLALALGIGGNTAIYSMVDSMLLEPLPFPDGDRLVMLWQENQRDGRSFNEVAPGVVRALQQRATAFEVIAPYDWFGFTLTGSGEPEQLAVRRELRALDPNLAVAGVRTYHEILREAAAPYRVTATLVSLFGALALVLPASRLMERFLFGIAPSDALSLMLAAGVLLAVAVAASAIPAWRASRVDPMEALRYE